MITKRIYSLCYLQNHLENMLLNSYQIATFLSDFCADTARSYTFKTQYNHKAFLICGTYLDTACVYARHNVSYPS